MKVPQVGIAKSNKDMLVTLYAHAAVQLQKEVILIAASQEESGWELETCNIIVRFVAIVKCISWANKAWGEKPFSSILDCYIF